jgi:hypothetical protein
MLTDRSITFVVPVTHRGDILEDNLLSSPCFREPHNYQLLIQESFASAATAFNDAIDRSVNDLIVFVHQDIYLPRSWLSQLDRAIELLEKADPKWGVLGCWGASPEDGCRGHIYSNGLGVLGAPFENPIPVQTLDEIVLILRKSSGLRFDEHLPNFHLHGADICLAAAEQRMKSYVISAFCVHNNNQYLILPGEFYQSYGHLKQTWDAKVPIQTTCIRITKFDVPMYTRRLREAYLRCISRRKLDDPRAHDVPRLLEQVDALLSGKSVTN